MEEWPIHKDGPLTQQFWGSPSYVLLILADRWSAPLVSPRHTNEWRKKRADRRSASDSACDSSWPYVYIVNKCPQQLITLLVTFRLSHANTSVPNPFASRFALAIQICIGSGANRLQAGCKPGTTFSQAGVVPCRRCCFPPYILSDLVHDAPQIYKTWCKRQMASIHMMLQMYSYDATNVARLGTGSLVNMPSAISSSLFSSVSSFRPLFLPSALERSIVHDAPQISNIPNEWCDLFTCTACVRACAQKQWKDLLWPWCRSIVVLRFLSFSNSIPALEKIDRSPDANIHHSK